jgi:hypothetical protein
VKPKPWVRAPPTPIALPNPHPVHFPTPSLHTAHMRLLPSLHTAVSRGYGVFTASTGSGARSDGLAPHHAYAVLDAVEVPGPAAGGGDRCFVKLKNPWRRGRWSGALSAEDPRGDAAWTPELMSALQVRSSALGACWRQGCQFALAR